MRARTGVALALLAAAAPLAAQGTVTIAGPAVSPIRDGTPAFTIGTSGFLAADLPLQLTLQIATQADFGGRLLADTTIANVTAASIVVPRLLPPGISIWWRARAITARGAAVFSNVVGPATTSPWLTLLSPNNRNGATLASKRPTFAWTAVAVHPPVSPWTFHIVIARTSDALPVVSAFLADTVFTSFIDLESNTSYRWSVTSVLSTGDSTQVNSFSTFVILDPNAPIATVLYPNFPNPFPTGLLDATCIWFDLKETADVRLDVIDLRGNHVARLIPGHGLGPTFPPGRYGRAAVGSDAGCDQSLTWDGRDDRGRYVPQGVYLIRFQGDGLTSTVKALWKGR